MIVRPAQLRPIPAFLLPFTHPSPAFQIRALQTTVTSTHGRVPHTTPFCPDVKTFLTLVGRGLSKHADKFPTWRGLFNMRGEQMKELGIEPPRTRRYLLHKLEQFRQRQYGTGGDLRFVKDGKAEVRIVEVETRKKRPGTATLSPNMKKIVVNVKPGMDVEKLDATDLRPVKGAHIKGADRVNGSHFVPIKGGGGAKIEVKEGLWEDKRGRKIDGGERRAAETRAKRRAEERRTSR